MYLISRSHKFIFVHTPKAGGSSITASLRPHANYACRQTPARHRMLRAVLFNRDSQQLSLFRPHVTAARLRQKLPASIWNSYFKFAFVRNPYAWLYSYYEFVRSREVNPQHRDVVAYDDFRGFVQALPEHKLFPAQYTFVCDSNKQVNVDFLGRMENLAVDIQHIHQQLGLPPRKLRHLNRSTKKSSDPLRHYDEEMLAIVNSVYRDDFLLFNYPQKTRCCA